ncbi:MAG TPA: hypothetical protein PLQ13_04625 [Candidatus Krumholzibacteria bacterium]|nr:hypothetical protein [Candidatus Krumholzibacteria bacterium]
MRRMIALIGASIGGAVGWWLGASVGLMTGWFLSVIGTAAGLYFGARFAAERLP